MAIFSAGVTGPTGPCVQGWATSAPKGRLLVPCCSAAVSDTAGCLSSRILRGQWATGHWGLTSQGRFQLCDHLAWLAAQSFLSAMRHANLQFSLPEGDPPSASARTTQCSLLAQWPVSCQPWSPGIWAGPYGGRPPLR